MPKLRIGILGAGKIAHRWMRDAHTVEEAEITCVGARDALRARAFAGQWGIPNAVEGYRALVEHPQVDAVYVATPHPMHCEHALLAMRAGKHVLCEKPAALNAAELQRMQACAKECGVFLMEAMWTRFFPAVLRAKQLLAEGAIGALRAVRAHFCFDVPFDAASRLFAKELGGGALLDVGCYPIAFALDMFGCAPDQVTGVARIGATGVDEQNAVALHFPGGGIAMLASGVRTTMPVEAVLYGETGSLHVPDFYHPHRLLLKLGGQIATVFDQPYVPEGFAFELRHMCECVAAGLPESPRMPHADSMAVMKVMDALRAQWGIVYPGEGQSCPS
ncbi:MAG: Gfo/Idh/MocA family oxidoreductase [Clostridia bacterium]|nr:Gfo/Idh/MocA family oxidoreductase [Clostridia bacterium]